MQIVIDIDDEQMLSAIKNRALGAESKFDKVIINALYNGTPLPKGHGRLIDADVIKDFKDRIKCYKEDYAFSQKEILNILERYEIKYALPIMEIDKENN